jgi:hypothetical protein
VDDEWPNPMVEQMGERKVDIDDLNGDYRWCLCGVLWLTIGLGFSQGGA